MTEHRWEVYPSGYDGTLFQCGGCRVLVESAAAARLVPRVCPGDQGLPHLLRTERTGLVCAGCTLPPGDEWDWRCGGHPALSTCDRCHNRRRSARYRNYHLAILCTQCVAKV